MFKPSKEPIIKKLRDSAYRAIKSLTSTKTEAKILARKFVLKASELNALAAQSNSPLLDNYCFYLKDIFSRVAKTDFTSSSQPKSSIVNAVSFYTEYLVTLMAFHKECKLKDRHLTSVLTKKGFPVAFSDFEKIKSKTDSVVKKTYSDFIRYMFEKGMMRLDEFIKLVNALPEKRHPIHAWRSQYSRFV